MADAMEGSGVDPEVNSMAAITRAVTSGARSALAKPTLRIFIPRRFQSFQLLKGRSGSPFVQNGPTIRETMKLEGIFGISQRMALPVIANMTSGMALFATYSAVESWAEKRLMYSDFLEEFMVLNSTAKDSILDKTSRMPFPEETATSSQILRRIGDESFEFKEDFVIPVTALASIVSGATHAAVSTPLDNFLHNLYLISTRKCAPSVKPPSSWLLNELNMKILRSVTTNNLNNIALEKSEFNIEGLKLKPLFYGWKGAMCRDMLGYGAFFLGFECTKMAMIKGTSSPYLNSLLQGSRDSFGEGYSGPPLSNLGTIIAGMVGGFGFRVISFPIDWKSDFCLAHEKLVVRYKKRKEWGRLAAAMFGRNKQFWPRFGRSLLFSMPGAALTFLVYENAKYSLL